MTIDFRSDTVTRPTAGMQAAMQGAAVGDDVFGEDPSVNELELYAAGLFGMEAAVFCPSGTMTNQIAIKCHTQPSDEIICERQSHIYQYEGGGIASNAGCQVKLIDGDRGRMTAAQVVAAINPDDLHKAPTRLVSLENTSNRGGGSCYYWNDIEEIHQVCREHQLKLHLDGARLFNALVAQKQTARQYGTTFDSISICLSKSLGAPIGSLLLGNKTFITQARRVRKRFGGGMRQAGYIAAAGLYALQNHVQRLEEDHVHAKLIADAVAVKKFVKNVLPVETNIIIFELDDSVTAVALVARLKERGILGYAIDVYKVRLVLHLDITPAMVQQTIDIIQSL